jgi:sulfate permease, SulP family
MSPLPSCILPLVDGESDDTLLRHGAMLVTTGLVERIHLLQVAADGSATPPAAVIEERLPHELSSLRTEGRVTVQALRGEPLDALLAAAVERSVDVILVGGRHGRLVRRSLARRLAMKAPCAVWMIPNGCAPAVEEILVPVDFSLRSAEALTLATGIGARLGLDRCTTVHVRFNSATTSCDEYDEILLEDVHRAFDVFTARIDLHDVDLRALFEEGSDVSATILRVARERRVDTIVMSTRGRSRAAAVLLGSETDHVMMRSPVPVLAVKRHGPRLRFLQALLERRTRRRDGARFG